MDTWEMLSGTGSGELQAGTCPMTQGDQRLDKHFLEQHPGAWCPSQGPPSATGRSCPLCQRLAAGSLWLLTNAHEASARGSLGRSVCLGLASSSSGHTTSQETHYTSKKGHGFLRESTSVSTEAKEAEPGKCWPIPGARSGLGSSGPDPGPRLTDMEVGGGERGRHVCRITGWKWKVLGRNRCL